MVDDNFMIIIVNSCLIFSDILLEEDAENLPGLAGGGGGRRRGRPGPSHSVPGHREREFSGDDDSDDNTDRDRIARL